MNSVLRGLAAEITPEWLQPKAAKGAADPKNPEDDADKPPMPAPRWKPDIDEPPIDPNADEADDSKEPSPPHE